MSQITLLWFSSRDKPFRAIHFRKAWAQVLLVGTCLLFFLCLGFGLLLWSYQGQLKQSKEKNAELKMDLANTRRVFAEKLERREQRLQSLQQDVQDKDLKLEDLEEKLLHSRQQMQELREMELKIRDYLGLEQMPPVEGDEHSHQGGFGLGQGQEQEWPRDFSLSNEQPQKSSGVVSYSLSLQDSMQEVLRHLEDRQQELDRMPSILPVDTDEFWISGDYGWRKNPYTSEKEFHSALDIASEWKTPIIAPAAGKVSKVGKNHIWGNYLRVDHGNGMRTAYGHLQSIKVQEGEEVQRHDVLGLMGSSGRSTGTHLHYKVIKEDEHVDPKKFVLDWKSEALTLRY
ncbi:MAG: peptidoglycan DD-metalloendopeptidase family protein [Desulfohalobiaceae bacterium]